MNSVDCDHLFNSNLKQSNMLDVVDFITERGGNPNAIRESQRKRNAPEAAVDEVIRLFEDHRTS